MRTPVTTGRSRLLSIVTAGLLLGWAAGAWGQTPRPQEPVRLDPTVTTATRTERTVEEIPVPVTVVSPEEIEATPAKTPDDLIRNLPGMNLSRGQSTVTHPTGQTIGMRGIGSNRALILVDGVPLNDAFGGWVNWSKVALPNVEQIELVKGGGSNLYGSYAMGGVINILTRVPDHDTARLEAGYGSFDTYRLNLYGAKVFDGGAVSLNVSQFETRGYHVIPVKFGPVRRGPVDKRAFSDSQTANLKLDYRLAPDLELSGSFSGYLNDINTGTDLATAAREGVDGSGTLSVDLHEMGQLRFTLFTGWQEFRNQNSRVANQGSLQRAFETVALRQYQPTFDLGGSAQWSRHISDVWDLVTVGLDGRHIRGENREKIYDTTPAAPEPGTFLRRRNTEATQFAGGVFGEVIVKPVPAWLISASARADYWSTYDAERREARAASGNPVPRRRFDDTVHTAISPKLATRYQINQHVAARAAGYHAIRFPTLNELYRGFFAGNIAFDANASLGPEEVTGAEAGVDLTLFDKRMVVKVTPFYNWVHDNITFVTRSPTQRMRENAGDAVSQGVDMESSFRVNRALELTANYIFTDSRYVYFDSDRTVKGNRVPNVSAHQVTGGLAYTNPALVDFAVRARYLSSSFGDDRNLDELDGHVVLDVSVSRAIHKHVELFAFAENITDERYLASRSGPIGTLASPFSVFGGVRVTF